MHLRNCFIAKHRKYIWGLGTNYDKPENKKRFNFRPKIVFIEGALCEANETCFLYKGFSYLWVLTVFQYFNQHS